MKKLLSLALALVLILGVTVIPASASSIDHPAGWEGLTPTNECTCGDNPIITDSSMFYDLGLSIDNKKFDNRMHTIVIQFHDIHQAYTPITIDLRTEEGRALYAEYEAKWQAMKNGETAVATPAPTVAPTPTPAPAATSAAGITVTEIVAPKYAEVKDFSEGLAAVKVDTGEQDKYGHPIYKWGFIDTTGKEVIPCQYKSVESFSEGLAAVYLNNKGYYIDKTGTKVISPSSNTFCRSFSEGLAAVSKNDKWGFIDKTGKEVIPCQYAGVTDFSEGLAGVRDKGQIYYDGKWGFIDKTGKEVVPRTLEYQTVRNFHDGFAAVGVGMYPFYKWGFIDKTGKEIISCKYDQADSYCFREGLAWVFEGNKGGYIDTTGKEVIPFQYDSVWTFSEGLAAVKLNGKWGYIDPTGKEVIPFQYQSAAAFFEGLAVVEDENWKWGFIDPTGKEVVPCTLDYYSVGNLHDGLAAVEGYGGWGFIAVDGDTDTPAPVPPATNTAYASTQTVNVDGKAVTFECYALKDASGNMTNYIKLRDLAILLNGSAAQFQVGWDGSVTITTKTAYTPNGSELSTPYSGDRTYQETTATTKVNGQAADLAAFVLNDDAGGGYTYYQLRDLGQTLGFNVGWAADKGIFVETNKPYDINN